MKQKQFLGVEAGSSNSTDQPKVSICSIPYEYSSSYGLGSMAGPSAIIDASHFVEFYDEGLKLQVCDELNINTEVPLEFDGAVNSNAIQLISDYASVQINKSDFCVFLGAEHTCTFPIFREYQKKYADLSILQLDAHSDLRDSYEENIYSHASVMARINESQPNIAQLGIRALCKEEADLISKSDNIYTVFGHQINKNDWQEPVLNHLTENVYVTIDADGFDPSIIPGTGTPEPGGLKWYETLEFLKKVFTTKNVVGFDIVECAPREHEIISEFTLAKLLYKLLGYRYLNKIYKL